MAAGSFFFFTFFASIPVMYIIFFFNKSLSLYDILYVSHFWQRGTRTQANEIRRINYRQERNSRGFRTRFLLFRSIKKFQKKK